jgi:hypothetical protein
VTFLAALETDRAPVTVTVTVTQGRPPTPSPHCSCSLGSWAGLTSLVTSPGHPHAQTVRYLLHSQVVEDFIDQQVSRLVVGGSVLLTTSGTRYFRRRNGYRPVRLRIRARDSRRREGTGTTGA